MKVGEIIKRSIPNGERLVKGAWREAKAGEMGSEKLLNHMNLSDLRSAVKEYAQHANVIASGGRSDEIIAATRGMSEARASLEEHIRSGLTKAAHEKPIIEPDLSASTYATSIIKKVDDSIQALGV